MKNYQFPEKQACIGDNVSLYAATKGMTDPPQYWGLVNCERFLFLADNRRFRLLHDTFAIF